jgi:hypothetical protein
MLAWPRRGFSEGGWRRALVLALAAGLAACQGAAEAPLAASEFVLTSSGGYVRSDAPPGIEVTIGSKRVLPASEELHREH